MEEFFNKYLKNFGKIGAMIEVLRPWNFILAGLISVIAYLFIADFSFNLIYLFILISLIVGGIHSINDYYDYEIDKKNALFKPLQSNRLNKKEVKNLVIFIWIFSLLASLFINFYFFISCLVLIIFGYFYSAPPFAFKNNTILANLVLGISFVFFPALCGASFYLNKFPTQSWFYYLFLSMSFFIGFLLLSKDFKDIIGDRMGGKNTFAVVLGIKKTLLISSIGTLIFFIITTFLFFQKIQKFNFVIFELLVYVGIIYFQMRFLKFEKQKDLANNFGLIRLCFFLYSIVIFFFVL